MTKRPGRIAANDPGLPALLDAQADAVCLVGKTWDFHVDVALEIRSSENIDGIARSHRGGGAKNREALFDAEHFFDGYKANPDYALACAKTALRCRRALGGAVRHQRRHAARRGLRIVSGGEGELPGDHARHPRSQRHRAGGGERARGGARRRAPDPGHAQRARRALRQCQSLFADRQPDAEAPAMPSDSRSASAANSSRT